MAEKEVWLQGNIDQLDIIGMYSSNKKQKIRLQVSIIVMISFVLFSILDIKYNCDTLEKYVEAFTTFLPAAASLAFLACFLANRKTLYEVVGILRNDFALDHHSIEAEITSLKLVKLSQYYLYFVFLVYVLLSIQSYLDREPLSNIHDAKANGLPARAWYPFDLTKKGYFIFFLILQQMTIIVVVHVSIPIAMCFAALLIHLRAQLFHLQDCLIQVCAENQDSRVARLMLNKCLRFHIMLINFTNKMQNAFGSILFIHNYSPSVVISVVGYQASMMGVLNPKFLPYMSCVNYVLAECFVYCYYGQHIIDQSALVGFMAYSNKWYNFPADIARDLSMIVMRSQKPLRMEFLGSTSASLETYYNIVKTGYSYFMFLVSMGDPDES